MTDGEAGDPDAGFDPGDDRLLLDAMLGKLATYLRMCGYDAAYVDSDAAPADLVDGSTGSDRDAAIRELASRESRTLLTRDRQLATATAGTAPRVILLTERPIEDQLRELADEGFRLELPDRPRRCATCNASLVAVGPEEPAPDYAPDPATVDCWRCPDCGQFFWRGSHWDDVAETLAGVRGAQSTDET